MCREWTIYNVTSDLKVTDQIGDEFEPCEDYYKPERCKDVTRHIKFLQLEPTPPGKGIEDYLPKPPADPAPIYTTRDMTPAGRSSSPARLYRSRGRSPATRYEVVRRSAECKKGAKRRRIWVPILSPLATITIDHVPKSKRRSRFRAAYPCKRDKEIYDVRPVKHDVVPDNPYRTMDFAPYLRGRKPGPGSAKSSSSSSSSSPSDSDPKPPPVPTPPREPSPDGTPLKSTMKQPSNTEAEKGTSTSPPEDETKPEDGPAAEDTKEATEVSPEDTDGKADASSSPKQAAATKDENGPSSAKAAPATDKAHKVTLLTPPSSPPLKKQPPEPINTRTMEHKPDTPPQTPTTPVKEPRKSSPERKSPQRKPEPSPPPKPKKARTRRGRRGCGHDVFTRGCEDCMSRLPPPFWPDDTLGYGPYMSGATGSVRWTTPLDKSVRMYGQTTGPDGVTHEWEWPPRAPGEPPRPRRDMPTMGDFWDPDFRFPFRDMRSPPRSPWANPDEHIYFAPSPPRRYHADDLEVDREREYRRRLEDRRRGRSL